MIENPTIEQLKTLMMIVYKITNIINNKCYIGKSESTFYRRYGSNGWWNGTDNILLYNSVQKYGLKNFKVDILEINIENKEKLKDIEDFYIMKYNSIQPNGFNFIYGKDHGKYKKKNNYTKIKKEKEYELVSPNGKIYKFNNLFKFCMEHELDYSSIKRVLSGKFKTYLNGWRRIGTEILVREIMSPEGISYKINENDLRRFSREFGLSHSSISGVMNRKTRHSFKWTNPNNPVDILEIVSNDGTIYIVNELDLPEFKREHKLCIEFLSKIRNSRTKTYKGWKINKIYKFLPKETIYYSS